MLSHKLIQCIEDHSEQLTAVIMERIRRDPELTIIGKLPASELRDIGFALLQNLGAWLAGDDREMIARQYQELGKRRCEENIPLHESVRALHIVKYETVDYAREQGFPQSSLEIYAEEEFEHRVNRFMDLLIYHMVRGYESALRNSAQKTQRVAATH